MTIHEIKPVIFTNMILFRSALVLNPENLQLFLSESGSNHVPGPGVWDVVRHL